jgi:hypothetical protein
VALAAVDAFPALAANAPEQTRGRLKPANFPQDCIQNAPGRHLAEEGSFSPLFLAYLAFHSTLR